VATRKWRRLAILESAEQKDLGGKVHEMAWAGRLPTAAVVLMRNL
jgi:hypothetical protein